MKLYYHEEPTYQFPHWVTFATIPSREDFNYIMDINEWAGEHFGELGIQWGHERKIDDSPSPLGKPANILLRQIIYSWRFKEKDHATLFKLRWHDA